MEQRWSFKFDVIRTVLHRSQSTYARRRANISILVLSNEKQKEVAPQTKASKYGNYLLESFDFMVKLIAI